MFRLVHVLFLFLVVLSYGGSCGLVWEEGGRIKLIINILVVLDGSCQEYLRSMTTSYVLMRANEKIKNIMNIHFADCCFAAILGGR